MQVSSILFILIFFVLQILYAVETNKISIPTVKMNAVMVNILSQYPDYDIIIHYDNTTIKDIYVFIEEIESFLQAILLLNYDRKNKFGRPVGYKFLNVVFLTNMFRFKQFSNILFNLEFNDIILLLSQETIPKEIEENQNIKTRHFWQQRGFERAGSTFMLDLTTNDLYYECFYCGHLNGILTKISNEEKIPHIRKYKNDFTNFHGQVFKIGYMTYLPFFWCGYVLTH